MSEAVTEEKLEVKKTRKVPVKFLAGRVLPLVVVALLAGGGVYYVAHKKPEVLGLSTTSTQAAETAKLLSSVEKLMSLPKDESPTVATVTDTEKLKSQSFFKNAQNGDKVLVYPSNKKIILFRPSENKIIDVGFVSTNQQASASATVAPAKTMKVFLFNGTDTVGATRDIEAKLKEKYKDAEISGRAVAVKTDYEGTIVVDLSGNRAEDAKKLASDLGVSVGSLPDGEKKPDNSDFLIIVGKGSAPVQTP